MLLAQDFRRQALVCARLTDDCDDPRLAERLRVMAADLLARAEDLKEGQACSVSSGSTRPHRRQLRSLRARLQIRATFRPSPRIDRAAFGHNGPVAHRRRRRSITPAAPATTP
jgi:hypothetical protein